MKTNTEMQVKRLVKHIFAALKNDLQSRANWSNLDSADFSPLVSLRVSEAKYLHRQPKYFPFQASSEIRRRSLIASRRLEYPESVRRDALRPPSRPSVDVGGCRAAISRPLKRSGWGHRAAHTLPLCANHVAILHHGASALLRHSPSLHT